MNKIHEWVNTGLIAIVLALVLVGGNQSGQTPSPELPDGFEKAGSFGTRLPNGLAVGSGKSLDVVGETELSTTTTEIFRHGGDVRATSTNNSAETLQQADLLYYGSIVYNPAVQDVTLTLPASSTLSSFIPNSGDMAEVYIRNSTTTVGIDITLAGASGTILKGAGATSTVLYYGHGGLLRFWRSSTSTDVYVTFEPK